MGEFDHAEDIEFPFGQAEESQTPVTCKTINCPGSPGLLWKKWVASLGDPGHTGGKSVNVFGGCFWSFPGLPNVLSGLIGLDSPRFGHASSQKRNGHGHDGARSDHGREPPFSWTFRASTHTCIALQVRS